MQLFRCLFRGDRGIRKIFTETLSFPDHNVDVLVSGSLPPSRDQNETAAARDTLSAVILDDIKVTVTHTWTSCYGGFRPMEHLAL